MAKLVHDGKRPPVGEYLNGLGWRMTTEPREDLFVGYGLPKPPTDAADPLNDQDYLRGTLSS